MIEHVLGESLSAGRGAEVCVESEGLHDGEVSLDCEHGCTRPLLLGDDLTTALVEHRVATTDRVFRCLDLDKVNGLLETGGGQQASSVCNTTGNGDDLPATTMDSVSMELDSKS